MQVGINKKELQTKLFFIYNNMFTFSGGLPKTALSSFTTIGLSINLGFAIITLIHSSPDNSFPLN
tara:strand:- start:17090 stop:17284 length:195 start_codon:yes stop_codon:yes gene_type:complete